MLAVDLPSSWLLLQIVASKNLIHCNARKHEASKIFIYCHSKWRHLGPQPRQLGRDLYKIINVPSCPMEEIDVVMRLKSLNICFDLIKKPIIFLQQMQHWTIYLRGSRYKHIVLAIMRHK